MKTFIAKEGKSLNLDPRLNCIPVEIFDYEEYVCPCLNHSGEIQRDNDKIIRFSCENRKMHQLPKIKNGGSKSTLRRRSKQEA